MNNFTEYTKPIIAVFVTIIIGLVFFGCNGNSDVPSTPDPNSEEVIETTVDLVKEMVRHKDTDFCKYSQVGSIFETSINEDIRTTVFETRIQEINGSPEVIDKNRQLRKSHPSLKDYTIGETQFYIRAKAQESRNGELVIQANILQEEGFLSLYPQFKHIFQ